MRKTLLLVFTAVLVFSLCFTLAACENDSGKNQTAKSVYKVTFFDNFIGGNESVAEVEPGQKVEKPADPTRAAYSFDGWYDDYSEGDPFDFDAEINADTNVYAHWTKTANVVTLKYNDGTDGQVYTVADGEKLIRPADPTSEEYEFIGWFSDAAYTRPFDFDTVINEHMTIYAGWSRSSVRLTFNLNYNGAPENVTISVGVDQAINLPENLETVRRLYEFDGWYLKSFPTEADLAVNLDEGIEEDTVLYAKWTRTHYEVVFNPNVQTMQSVSVEVPVSDPEAEVPEFARNGYTLDEVWYGEAGLVNAIDLTKVNDDITVYAKWNINYYDVTFSLNYDESPAAPAAQSVAYHGYVTRPDNPERDGFVFLGWYTDPEVGVQFNFEEDYVSTALDIYAHWMASQDVGGNIKVTFNYNLKLMTETVYKEVSIEMGEALGDKRMPAAPQLASDDLMFIGWYKEAGCKNVFDPSAILLEDTAVYARILKGTTFEAEYVNLDGMHGVGSSVELPEEAMLFDYSKIGNGTNQGKEWVSNGWYLAGLYYKGAYIEFEINASRDIENAVLMLRVSSEFRTLMYNPLTPATYRIDINPVEDINGNVTDDSNFNYELPLTLPLPNTVSSSDADGAKTPFENVIVSYKFHLEKGLNYVRFTTNNYYDYGDGTFKANAPMFDCIKIFTEEDVVLEMNEYTEFLDRKNN